MRPFEAKVRDTATGISIRFVQQFDIERSKFISRLDVRLWTADELAAMLGAPCYPSSLDC